METKQQKTFVKRPAWVEKPRRMPILSCACGNKYVHTRVDQTVCVQCINKKDVK